MFVYINITRNFSTSSNKISAVACMVVENNCKGSETGYVMFIYIDDFDVNISGFRNVVSAVTDIV